MKYRSLGRTGVQVSELCLGCMTFGDKTLPKDAYSIIDRAIEHGGRFFLTYHRWATRDQVETCYPKFQAFLKKKIEYDPSLRFQSDWYRYYSTLFETH